MGFLRGFAVVGARARGGAITSNLGTAGVAGSPLSLASSLASTRPGLSQAEFAEALDRLMGSPAGPFGGKPKPTFDIGRAYGVYRQLTSTTGGDLPTTGAEVTSPEPEGPGRFEATRPGDLLGAASLRFGS